MSLKNKIIIFFVLLNLLLIAIIGDLWLIFNNEHHLSELQIRRYDSRLLAEELRRSSDDLTRMARSYVITGDERFLKYFKDISSIRDGKIGRPLNYNNIFWDFISSGKDHIYRIGDKRSILEEMNILNFTESEKEILRKAKNLSDDLIKLEEKAFNILKGIYPDKFGSYTIKGKPDPVLAAKTLFSDEYHHAKAKIMEQINIFFHLINARTESEVKKVSELQILYIFIAITLSLTMTGMGTIGYFFFHRDITNPLVKLGKWIKMMQKGEYSFNTEGYKNDEIGLLACGFANMAKQVSEYINNLEYVSRTDPLTKLNNRITLDIVFQSEYYKFNRYGTPCAIVILDIDRFKYINDTFGHVTGDFVLIRLAKILKKMTRHSDTAGRWGGEEFVVICPNTELTGAKSLAENIRKEISEHDFGIGHQITVSLGTAIFEKDLSIEDTVKKADDLLYKAKNEGRNRVG